MHPGEQVLLRIIGQGRWQHPFHEHGNHVRILGRDGNLILSPTDAQRARWACALHHHDNSRAGDGRNLLLDGQGPELGYVRSQPHFARPERQTALYSGCQRLQHRRNPTAINYFEWCQDHNKPLEAAPFGDVAGGGPVTLPDPNHVYQRRLVRRQSLSRSERDTALTGAVPTAGQSARAATPVRLLPQARSRTRPRGEAGFAFMWHSHNEREITTNNIFPGGMMMMMLVDSREFVIDETN